MILQMMLNRYQCNNISPFAEVSVHFFFTFCILKNVCATFSLANISPV